MKLLPNGGKLIECVSELPDFRNAEYLYADFETTSGNPSEMSVNPWHNCEALGICVTVDDFPGAIYVPIAHEYGRNLPREAVVQWWKDTVLTCKRWVNHNIKYDAHVSANSLGVLPEQCKLICTLTLAKIVDSDRFSYGLDVLSKEWLGEDIGQYEHAFKPYLHKNKDYGKIPVDIMAPYGCQDVITNRRLYKFICDQMPEECSRVRDTEIEVTRVLLDIERHGLYVDKEELQVQQFLCLNRLMQISEELEKITGRAINPASNAECFDLLCNQYGLPVLEWTETGNPSFDKATLAKYEAHPFAPTAAVKLINEYRKTTTFHGLFIEKWLELADENGILHSDYNQSVRTARLSCKNPNAMQLNTRAKELIHPRPGNTFLSKDQSQIEFRLIGHYIRDEDIIAAYAANPDEDFHTWVAELVGIARKPAKTINFMMGYGGGIKKTISLLAASPEIVAEIKAQVDDMELDDAQKMEVFAELAEKKARRVYDTYHAKLPNLKNTSREAERAARRNGYVRNLFGRRRHLPRQRCHIAFNTANQSSAADLLKDQMVTLHHALKKTEVNIVVQVHDELVFEGPHEIVEDPRFLRDVTEIMETATVPLRIPLRTSHGLSRTSWAEAAGAEQKYSKGDLSDSQNFSWI